jgi:hypothetical protein
MTATTRARNHPIWDRPFTDRILADTRLSTKAKCLGLVLSSLGDDAPCFAPMDELALICGLGKNSIITARQELERLGYVSVERRSGRIHRYVLHIPSAEVNA